MKTTINDRPRERARLQTFFPEPTLTKLSFQKECDINVIMAQYRRTGLIDHTSVHQGRYDDLPTNTDYHTDLNAVIAADAAFKSLPAAMRAGFNNDPAEFLGFVLDPDNKEEIAKMGLGPAEPTAAALAASTPAEKAQTETPIAEGS